MPFGKELLAEAVVRNRNAQPHGDRREATIEVRITKTVSAAMTLEPRARSPPIMLKASAFTGTPRLLSLARLLGIMPSFPSAQTMRPEA